MIFAKKFKKFHQNSYFFFQIGIHADPPYDQNKCKYYRVLHKCLIRHRDRSWNTSWILNMGEGDSSKIDVCKVSPNGKDFAELKKFNVKFCCCSHIFKNQKIASFENYKNLAVPKSDRSFFCQLSKKFSDISKYL